MRNRYIVAYDVSEAKRLRRVFRKMRGFGDPLQYSVFICELSPKERAILIDALNGLIHHTEDRVIIVNIGGSEAEPKERIEFLGRHVKLPARQAVIV